MFLLSPSGWAIVRFTLRASVKDTEPKLSTATTSSTVFCPLPCFTHYLLTLVPDPHSRLRCLCAGWCLRLRLLAKAVD